MKEYDDLFALPEHSSKNSDRSMDLPFGTAAENTSSSVKSQNVYFTREDAVPGRAGAANCRQFEAIQTFQPPCIQYHTRQVMDDRSGRETCEVRGMGYIEDISIYPRILYPQVPAPAMSPKIIYI